MPVVTEATVSQFLETADPEASVVTDIVSMGDANPVLASFLATYIDEAGVEGLDDSHPDVIGTGAFVEGFLACYAILASQATSDLLGYGDTSYETTQWEPEGDHDGV